MKIAKSKLDENDVCKIKLEDIVKSLEKNIMIYSDMLEEDIEVSKKIEDNNSYVYGNIVNINECLIQLLNNAYEHREKTIKVEINLNNNLEIDVIDDGLGFDKEMLINSKKLFVTSNVGRTSGKGYGIGLYYVNNYLEKISGKLELYNGEKGAIAKMLIPVEGYDD
ncbi:MAG: ATP-binding protein [Peptoniphilaceae bacterium]|nr:ATP-binding protein [Peptoniphilaceae bacterium]MDY6018689.1 ATP-binding protein [Anaerococcus sp.]